MCPRCGYRIVKPDELEKATRRATAEIETARDLEKPLSHLLSDIHDESLDRTRLEGETVARTMARFAALQVVLSREADSTAEKNLQLSRSNLALSSSVNRLTYIIAGLTLIMTALGIVQAYYSYRSYHLSAAKTDPNAASSAGGKEKLESKGQLGDKK